MVDGAEREDHLEQTPPCYHGGFDALVRCTRFSVGALDLDVHYYRGMIAQRMGFDSWNAQPPIYHTLQRSAEDENRRPRHSRIVSTHSESETDPGLELTLTSHNMSLIFRAGVSEICSPGRHKRA